MPGIAALVAIEALADSDELAALFGTGARLGIQELPGIETLIATEALAGSDELVALFGIEAQLGNRS